jgi:hypothetical protein
VGLKDAAVLVDVEENTFCNSILSHVDGEQMVATLE